MRSALAVPVLLLMAGSSFAQGPSASPAGAGGISVSGSIRTRVEAWDWFGGDAKGNYVFSGSLARLALKQTRRRFEWQVEFAIPVLLGLPSDAAVAAPQGQLGLGASYFVANDRKQNIASAFLKQGSLAWHDVGGVSGQSLRLGRMEFIDGAEATPKDPTLAAVKRDRISHRLAGNFGFSHVGRSFDAVEYAVDRPAWNVTLLAGRPTQGVFKVNGWGDLDINVYYGALTGQVQGSTHAAEWRLFGLGYKDGRAGPVKTDNRSLAERSADTNGINLFTVGGHYLDAVTTPSGTVDVLFWGAVQTGSWGSLSQKSGAFAAEGGWQPVAPARLRPWIRAGYDWASGDGAKSDGTHGTFFQVLPTPRLYARFPFFNSMNIADAFAEVVVRPSAHLALRGDVHSLRLADSADLWYVGGGAFEPNTFGYAGRPSNGHRDIATLADISAALNLGRTAVTAYFGHAAGGAVTSAIYSGSVAANYGYVELLWRF